MAAIQHEQRASISWEGAISIADIEALGDFVPDVTISTCFLVARMEREARNPGTARRSSSPDCAALHPGYERQLAAP
jgi:hypothetical protein